MSIRVFMYNTVGYCICYYRGCDQCINRKQQQLVHNTYVPSHSHLHSILFNKYESLKRAGWTHIAKARGAK